MESTNFRQFKSIDRIIIGVVYFYKTFDDFIFKFILNLISRHLKTRKGTSKIVVMFKQGICFVFIIFFFAVYYSDGK